MRRTWLAAALWLTGCNSISAKARVEDDKLHLDIQTKGGATVYVRASRNGDGARGDFDRTVDAPPGGHLSLESALGRTQAGTYTVHVSSVVYRKPLSNAVAEQELTVTIPPRPFLSIAGCADTGAWKVTLHTDLLGVTKDGLRCSLDTQLHLEVSLIGPEGGEVTIDGARVKFDDKGTVKARVSVLRWFDSLRVAEVAQDWKKPKDGLPTATTPLPPHDLRLRMTVDDQVLEPKISVSDAKLPLASIAWAWAEQARKGLRPTQKATSGGLALLDGFWFVGAPETLGDVRWIVTDEVVRTEKIGTCGPYSSGDFFDVVRKDYRLTVVDRDGKESRRQELRGTHPGCPQTILTGAGGVVITARPHDGDMLEWLGKTLK